MNASLIEIGVGVVSAALMACGGTGAEGSARSLPPARSTAVAVGTIAYVGCSATDSQARCTESGIFTIRTDGSRRRLIVRDAEDPAWSPDGRRIAYWPHKDGGVWIVRADGTGRRRLTTPRHEGLDNELSWSPDGRRIVFHREWTQDEEQPVDLYAVDVSTRRITNLTRTPDIWEFNPAWSPDGRLIAFDGEGASGEDIFVLDLTTHRTRRLTGELFAAEPDWSPNGTRIAYMMDAGAKQAIAVMQADGSGQRQIITSLEHLNSPSWSPDGSHIAYATFGTGEGATARPGWLSIARADGTGARRLVRDGIVPDWRPR